MLQNKCGRGSCNYCYSKVQVRLRELQNPNPPRRYAKPAKTRVLLAERGEFPLGVQSPDNIVQKSLLRTIHMRDTCDEL
jgi:hypothetical protein